MATALSKVMEMVRAVEVALPGHPAILNLRGGAYIKNDVGATHAALLGLSESHSNFRQHHTPIPNHPCR